MNCILQVSHVDANLLPQMAEMMRYCGPNPGYGLIIIAHKAAPPTDVAGFADQVRALFDKVEIVTVDTPAKGWPVAANQMFREAAKVASDRGQPWLNLELDCVLLPGWLRKLFDEYHLHKKPFLGRVIPTKGFRFTPDGKTEPFEATDDPHMVGVGVYPPGFYQASLKLKTVDVLMMWADTPLEPYDVALRMEIAPFAHASNLIAHNFRTRNYRLEPGGTLTCENSKDSKHDFVNPIHPDSVIIHGCKDDSLARIILSGAKFGKSPTQPATTKAPPEPKIEQKPEATPELTPEEIAPRSYLATRVHNLMLDGKAYQLKKAAQKLEVDAKLLEEEIKKPGSGLALRGPAKWVIVQ